jgi:hypothetical protein
MQTSYDSVLSLGRKWRAKGYGEIPYLADEVKWDKVVDAEAHCYIDTPSRAADLDGSGCIVGNSSLGMSRLTWGCNAFHAQCFSRAESGSRCEAHSFRSPDSSNTAGIAEAMIAHARLDTTPEELEAMAAREGLTQLY